MSTVYPTQTQDLCVSFLSCACPRTNCPCILGSELQSTSSALLLTFPEDRHCDLLFLGRKLTHSREGVCSECRIPYWDIPGLEGLCPGHRS